jgi:predicted enzyme related to lactoylglutathione lyase
MTRNPFSHIDLSVTSFDVALPFYEKIMPALGFPRTYHSPKWKVFASEGVFPGAAYFALVEKADHIPNKNIIAFWAEDRARVDTIAQIVTEAGGKILNGPAKFPISSDYYAVYFEDPCGNRFECVHRTA